jgi:tRNA-Thr(GGU) m(6)t(6)A37 methyltransferase TsaA
MIATSTRSGGNIASMSETSSISGSPSSVNKVDFRNSEPAQVARNSWPQYTRRCDPPANQNIRQTSTYCWERTMKRVCITTVGALALALLFAPWLGAGEAEQQQPSAFVAHPIGHVKKSQDRTLIVVDKKYQPGLLGLDGYSHIYMFWWFDKNDTPEKRAVLQVHPMGNRDNPLTGVFATRSPVRPNLIALTLCRLVSVKENVIEIAKTDAFDGTPVLDIKPFIPGYDTADDATLPDWLEKARKQRAEKTD